MGITGLERAAQGVEPIPVTAQLGSIAFLIQVVAPKHDDLFGAGVFNGLPLDRRAKFYATGSVAPKCKA